jgi:hypothetical protein
MRTKTLVRVSFLTLFIAAVAYGQGRTLVTAKIPFAFSAAGKTLPPGQYEFRRGSNAESITISGSDKDSNVILPVITRLAAGIHTTPKDAHVVFDLVGTTHTLSEVWVSNEDGYMLSVTKGSHKHEVLDIPTK